MKILELKIQGYRSLKDVTWKPGDLNLIIGPNGSGKSNLLKALEMLSASARGKLADQVIREGGMGAMAWDGKANSVQYRMHLQQPLLESAEEINHFGSVFSYQFALDRLGKTSQYRISKERLTQAATEEMLDHDGDYYIWLSREGDELDVFDAHGGVLKSNRLSEEESLLSSLSSPLIQKLPATPIRDYLADWVIYQDFQTSPSSPVRQAAIARFEQQVSSNGDNLVQVLHTLYSNDRQFREDVNQGMRVAFNWEFEELVFPPAADQRIQLRVGWKKLSQSQTSADLSDGTLRYLYLITILANPNPPALIAIDEPEIGLHPSMLPLVAEYARNAAIRSQVIITTHSAELLDAFSEFDPTVTVTKWEEGQSVFQVVSKDHLDYWLQNYTLGKLYRTGGLEDME